MAGRTFVFDPPDRFVAGAVGQPGQRTFFLQAAKGSAILSVALEKVQVALLAERIGELIEAIARSGATEAQKPVRSGFGIAGAGVDPAAPTLQEPVVEAFRVGSMSLAYDEERRALILEAREAGETDETDEGEQGDAAAEATERPDGRHLLRVRLSLEEARRFAEGALQVVAAGRPPCPICGEPLDPQGHICLRRNGYLM